MNSVKSRKRIFTAIIIVSMILQAFIPNINNGLTSQAAVAVKKVKVNISQLTMYEGQSKTLKAAISPSDASNKKVQWSSSNKKIAMVSSNGTVKGVKAGTAMIVAKTSNNKKSACKVIIKKKEIPIQLSLKEKEISMTLEDTITLNVQVTPSNLELEWESSDEDIVFVDSDGVLTPVNSGNATITVTAPNGKSERCIVTVADSEQNNPEQDNSMDEDYNGAVEDLTTLPEETTEDVSKLPDTSHSNVVPEQSNTVQDTVPISIGDGTFRFVLKDTNLSLDVFGALSNNGNNIQVHDTNNTPAQVFRSEKQENGSFSLIPECATDKVVDVMRTGNSTKGELKEGCNVDIYTHNDPKAQHFVVERFSDNSCTIRLSSNPDLVLQAASKVKDANVTVGKFNKDNHLQRWYLKDATVDVPANPVPQRASLENAAYRFTLAGTNFCLDVTGAVNKNGANVELYNKNDTVAQRWGVENNSDNTISLYPACASDKVLDVMRTGNSTKGELKEGCNVDIYLRNDSTAQNFYLEQFKDGTYLIRLNANPDIVVGAERSMNEANVSMQKYNPNNSLQRWTVTKLGNVEENKSLGHISSAQIETAINWAIARKGSNDYNNLCAKFIGDAFRAAGVNNKGYRTATLAGNALITNTDTNPPRGAVVFYNWFGTISGKYENYGHIGISLGNGQVVHADYNGVKVTNLNIDKSRGYRGWGIWK